MKPANDATSTERRWLLTAAMGIALGLGFIGLVIARERVDSFVLAYWPSLRFPSSSVLG